jgi:hypothetical protein
MELPGIDLEGRDVIMTGAERGLGRATGISMSGLSIDYSANRCAILFSVSLIVK